MEKKRKLNILLLSWRGPGHSNAGGAEIVTHEHAKAWVKEGHRVTLFTSSFEGGKEFETLDGVLIIRRGNQILSVQWEAFKWYLFESKSKFDLVVDHFHGVPFFTPLYVRSRKLGFIHEVTKNVWRYNYLPEPWHSIVYLLGEYGESWIFKLFYTKVPFVTVSQSTKNDLINFGVREKNISVIKNGTYLLDYKIPTKKEKVVTFIGSLSRDKGVEDALKVFSLLMKKSPQLKFWVIGRHEPKYFDLLNKMTNDLALKSKLKYWGFVNDKKKYELLSKSLIVINPSIREGWGLTVIESAVVGTPTVGYNVSGLRDSIINNKTGLLTSFNNPEEMANLVIDLLKNKSKYQTLSKQARLWGRSFDWETATKKSSRIITKIGLSIA